MNIGIIGTGSMGTLLVESFLESNVISENELFITNRTIQKAYELKKAHPNITVIETIQTLVTKTDLLFLCTKPLEIVSVAKQLAPLLHPKKRIISITSPISVEQLEYIVDCKVARVIPTILNQALTGPSLLSFGERCTDEDKQLITYVMSAISEPLVIDENITRVSSDIVSCGPAFFSYLLQQFIEAAVRQTDITTEDATTLATNMIIGLGKLLEKEHFTLPTLQQRVHVPGGITGEGIKVLERGIGNLFDKLFQQTEKKYEQEKEIITSTIHKK